MKRCDRRCQGCKNYDPALNGCVYALRYEHSRGTAIPWGFTRKIIYTDPCDKFEPKDGAVDTLGDTFKFKKARRKLRSYPERDKLYAQGLPDRVIAQRLGVKMSSIVHWRKVRGLVPHEDPEAVYGVGGGRLKRVPERDELYARGLTDGQMAKALSVSRETIRNWRQARGLPANGEYKVKTAQQEPKGAANDNQRQGVGQDA